MIHIIGKFLFSGLILSSQNIAYSLSLDQWTPHVQAAPDLSHLSLPNSSLPLSSDLRLKYVALGVGTQNYTCNSATAEVFPVAFGATASLFDIGPLLISLSGPSLQNAIPPLALAVYGSLSAPESSAVWSQMLSALPSSDRAALANVAFGDHIFVESDGVLVPSWVLTPSRALYPDEPATIVLQGKKADSSPAPDGAYRGLHAEGAVDWLYLTEASGSDEICAIYRVVTAGGKPPENCEAANGAEIEVEYAAEYWFYGRVDATA